MRLSQSDVFWYVNIQNPHVMQTETLYYGDRKISIRTSVLEEKATACNMLCCYADELEVGFFPYVEQVLLRHLCYRSHCSCTMQSEAGCGLLLFNLAASGAQQDCVCQAAVDAAVWCKLLCILCKVFCSRLQLILRLWQGHVRIPLHL